MSASQTTQVYFVQPKPLVVTIAVHALLLVLLLLWRFSLPAQETTLPEMGMEVNLGTSDNGSGTDQPMDVEDPAPSAAASRSAGGAASAQSDIERGDDEEAPAVNHPVRADRQRTATNTLAPRRAASVAPATATAHTAAPQRPRYVYQGSNGRGGNGAAANAPGTNEGNTTGTGDRGVPHGTPGAANYSGTPGSGTGGISYNLSGRTMIAFPPKEAQFRAGGRVVVRVTVSRSGAVTNSQIKSTTNSELNPIALRKVQQVRFNASENAPEEQFGDITFVFKTRQ